MADTAIEKTYKLIRDSIYSRKYEPGFHLKEEELSESLNISRTPVRQAIRMLADEGLVCIRENRRSHVADIKDEDMEIIFDLIAMVESYSAGIAATKITEEQLSKLKEIQDTLERGDHENDVEFLEANYEFHNTIHQAAGSRTIRKLVKQVINLSAICYLKVGVHTENETAINQHREIIDALEMGDSDFAALKMRVHIETVRQQYREILREQENEL